jgi:hypothetical protein
MTSITYLNDVKLCRQKARECQRSALISTHHGIRARYWHLAKLWHEMAREAERKMNGSSPPDVGVVIIPMRFQKRRNSQSERIEAVGPL